MRCCLNTILIHKYDRIARNLGEHVNLEARLKEKGIALIAVAQDFGSSSESKIMRALMWSLSEYYSDNLAQEVKKGHRETALRGLHNGGSAPFGYDVSEQHYIVNEWEAHWVRRMFNAALARAGFAHLVDEMAAAGVTGKRGKPIKYPQIYEILRNEKYTGVYAYSIDEEKNRQKRRDKPNAIRIDNALPAIVSKEQFQEVQKIMNERKQTGTRNTYMCSGLVFCRCGAKMHVMRPSRKGHEYSYYHCSARCGAPVVQLEEVDNAALRYLKTLLADDNQLKIADSLRAYDAGNVSREADFNKMLRNKIAAKKREYEMLMQNLSSGALPPDVLEDIGARMQQLKKQIEMLKNTKPPKEYTVSTIRAWLSAIKAQPDREAVRRMISRIDIVQDREKPNSTCKAH